MQPSIPTNKTAIWQELEAIPDPEIPVIYIVDLGMIRSVECQDQRIIIHLSPTYNGCPALEVIQMQIRATLEQSFHRSVEVKLALDPPWTTDWITPSGREKLRNYGIAPPQPRKAPSGWRDETANVSCPHCGSSATGLVSAYGSTPCKALYRCNDCLEPFDYFKCH